MCSNFVGFSSFSSSSSSSYCFSGMISRNCETFWKKSAVSAWFLSHLINFPFPYLLEVRFPLAIFFYQWPGNASGFVFNRFLVSGSSSLPLVLYFFSPLFVFYFLMFIYQMVLSFGLWTLSIGFFIISSILDRYVVLSFCIFCFL